jgi:hypothetical protein
MGKPRLTDYQLRGLIIQVRDAARAGGRAGGFAWDLLLVVGMWNRPCRRLDYAISRRINDHESLRYAFALRTRERGGERRGERGGGRTPCRSVRFNCVGATAMHLIARDYMPSMALRIYRSRSPNISTRFSDRYISPCSVMPLGS